MEVIKTFDKLYSKTSSGKINEWSICIKSDNNIAYICTYSGLVGGKITEYIKKVHKGKNIGKKNETTVLEQALAEAQSMWTKRIDKNNCKLSKDELLVNLDIVPMTAQYFDSRSKYIDYDCAYCQPKLDGVRCIRVNKQLLSKNNLKFNNLEHIENEIIKLGLKDGICLDGELYTDNFPFNKINGYVRRVSSNNDNMENIKCIEYHIFDCFDTNNVDWAFEDRYKYLSKLLKKPNNILKLVHTVKIDNQDDVYSTNEIFVSQGYEGIMIRNGKGLYKNSKTRSNDLQKYKLFKDDEFKIIGFTEGSGQDEGTVIWKCITELEHEFMVRPKGSREDRMNMFNNGKKYIGKLLTVKYQELSEDGVPRFPVGLRIREIDH